MRLQSPMKASGLVVVVAAACGGPRRPVQVATPAPREPSWQERPTCKLTPIRRPDGLLELRRDPQQIAPWPCNGETMAAPLQWLEAPDHALIATASTFMEAGYPPVAERDDPDGTHVVEARSRTDDLRCAGPDDAPGALVAIDRPDQASPGWIPIAATDRPIRLVYEYRVGGCSYEREGDHLVVHVETATAPGATAPRRHAIADEPRDDGDYVQVDGDLVVLSVPYDPNGACRGEGPPESGASSSSGGEGPYGFGVGPIDIEVPATGARVIVRRYYLRPTQCA